MRQPYQFINHNPAHVTVNKYTLAPRGKVVLEMDMNQDLVDALAKQKVEVHAYVGGKLTYMPPSPAKVAPEPVAPRSKVVEVAVVEVPPTAANPDPVTVAAAEVVEVTETPVVEDAAPLEADVEETNPVEETSEGEPVDQRRAELMAAHVNKLRKMARKLGLDDSLNKDALVELLLAADNG